MKERRSDGVKSSHHFINIFQVKNEKRSMDLHMLYTCRLALIFYQFLISTLVAKRLFKSKEALCCFEDLARTMKQGNFVKQRIA